MQDTRLITLVRQAQAGSREAFGELVQQFESTVFAVVMRRLRNQAEAAEVTQEVLLRAMRKLPQLREPERFVGWLKRIAVRMSINRAVRRPGDQKEKGREITHSLPLSTYSAPRVLRQDPPGPAESLGRGRDLRK